MIRSFSTVCTSGMSTGVRFRLANAVTRMSVPSSSRMLRDTFDAMYSRISSGTWRRSDCAFLRRMAMRVSRSGACTSVMRPHSNRLTHAVLEAGEVLRRHVARDHDLLVVVVQRVERVEERLLRLGLALQELDVVDQQDVDVAVALLEQRAPVVGDRVDEVVREFLGATRSARGCPDTGSSRSGRWRAGGGSCRDRSRRR